MSFDEEPPRDQHDECRHEIRRLQIDLGEAKEWLHACLGLVEGHGPPNWDGIRTFLKKQ